jgi:hypothetical protein
MEVSGQVHAPATLFHGKTPGIHCIGGLMGPTAAWKLWGRKNLSSLPEIKPKASIL